MFTGNSGWCWSKLGHVRASDCWYGVCERISRAADHRVEVLDSVGNDNSVEIEIEDLPFLSRLLRRPPLSLSSSG